MPRIKNVSPGDARKTRTLPVIPSEPTSTKEQIEAEFRKKNFAKSVPEKTQRLMAEFFCYAEQRLQFPDLFWHPFAPPEYKGYLKSDLWRRISKKIKIGANNKCACCANKATQVHHRCYRPRVLSGEDTSLLIALCAACHKAVDFDEQGIVREAHAKERTLSEMFDRESNRLAFIIRSF